MRKKFIQKRWKVVGMYCFSEEFPYWKFDGEFHEKNAVWDFNDNSISCYSNGLPMRTLPYKLFGSKVMIDHWEAYFLEKSGRDLFLCEPNCDTYTTSWQAIKLTPAK